MNHLARLLSVVCLALLVATAGLHGGEIHDAVTAGDLDKVRALLEADPGLLESKDPWNHTPLHKACWGEQIAVAHFLIDQGANVNARNEYGVSVLSCAISSKEECFDLVKRLIDEGADINVEHSAVGSPLHRAASRGNHKVARLLIDHGADLNAPGRHGTILQQAVMKENPDEEMVELLLENGAKRQEYNFGNTELHLAALHGHANLVRTLVRHGAEVDARNDYDRTPLCYAAMHGHRTTAEALTAVGADKSTMVETNYSKASQLAEELKEGEAHVWYLGGMAPATGYAVKTRYNLLVFDPYEIDESPEAGLANGHLNSNELADQKMTVLFTRKERHPFTPTVSELAQRLPIADFVLGVQPTAENEESGDIPAYHLATDNQTLSVGGMQIHTIAARPSTLSSTGNVGHLVEVDGVRVLHAGLHVSKNRSPEIEQYRQEIDFLRPSGPIDFAILPIRGRHIHSLDYEPYLYLIDQLEPNAIYSIGDDLVYEEHRRCIEALKARDVPVFYPDGGIAMGQRFHYPPPETPDFTDLYGDYLGQTPPGDTPVVFAPGIVSTIYMEHSALAFSPDGDEVFWRVAKGFISDPDLSVVPKTMKRIGDRWTVPMDSPYGGSPFFSPDGKRLYFSHLLPDGKADGPYFVEKQGNGWSEPKNIGLVARFPELKSVYGPTITRDGTLYFAGDTAGKGMLKDHLLYRARLRNGEYTELELLPRRINLPHYWNYSPFIAPDESYLIFSSNRPGSLDEHGDLYISFRDISTDTWSEPVNMGEPINTGGQESSPGLSPDGKYLFFTGPNANRQADIFWVSAGIIDRLKAKVVQQQRRKAGALEENVK